MKRTSISFAAAALAAVATVASANTGTWNPAEMKDAYMSFTDAANWQDSYVPTNDNDSAVFAKVSQNANDRGSLSGNSWQAPIFGNVTLPTLASGTFWDSIAGIRQYRLRSNENHVSPTWSVTDVSGFLGKFELLNYGVLNIRAAESGRTQLLHGIAVAGRPTLAVEGGTVELGQLSGAGTLQKTGSGALDLAGVSAAPGVRIHAAEGSVRLRGVSDSSSPVPGMALHLDASRVDSITTNASGAVTAIADVRGGADAGYRKATTVNGSPRLVDFGNLKLLNLGHDSSASGDASALAEAWGTPSFMALDQAVSDVKSLFVVFRYNVSDGNGSESFPVNDITGQELRRPYPISETENNAAMSNTIYMVDRSATTMFLYQQYQYTYQSLAPQAVVTGDLRRDGESVSHRNTPRSFRDGLECFSLNVNTNAYTGGALPELGIKYLARCQDAGKTGGCRIGEVLIYTNSLTDAEQKRNLDYLMDKWGGAEGRRHWTAGTLSGTTGASFDVADGETATVRSIDTRSGVFVKNGGGTLRARHVSGNGAILVEGGSVEFVGGQAPAVPSLETSNPQPALGISSRFDASAGTDYMVTEAEGGTNFVLRWNSTVRNYSTSKYNLALMVTNATQSAFQGMRPFLTEDAQGHAWVDFGDLTAATSSISDTPTSGWFRVTRTTDFVDLGENSVRELFWVWDPRPAANGANPIFFGGSGQWQRYAIPAKGRILSSGSPYDTTTPNHANFLNTLHAQWAVDGVPVDPALDNWTAGPHVVRVSFGRPTYMTAIGCDYLRTKGGFRLGELIVYTRELTDRERVETEAYLLNKWKGAEHPDRSGDTPAPAQVVYASAPSSIAAPEGASVRFSLAENNGEDLPALFSEAFIHIDASDLSTVTYAADAGGDLRVSSIADPRVNGLSAANPYSGAAKPILRLGAQNGRNVIDLGQNGTAEASALRWHRNGAAISCGNEVGAIIVYRNRDDGYYADPFSTFGSGNTTWRAGGHFIRVGSVGRHGRPRHPGERGGPLRRGDDPRGGRERRFLARGVDGLDRRP